MRLRKTDVSRRRFVFTKGTLVLGLMALVPLLVFSGGGATTTQAALPTSGLKTQNPVQFTGLVLRVYFHDTDERDRLATELGAEEVTTTGGYLTVVGDQALLDSLKARGLRVEIDQAQTAAYNTPVQFGHNTDTFFNGYYTVEELQTFMDDKVAAYPDLVEKVDIGDSWCKTHLGVCTQPNTWNGYDLIALHITNRNIAGPKPVFWYNSGIHAREIAVPEVALRYVNYLLDGYDNNADAHWLVDYQDIWVLLTMNPDGHHMVENGTGSPRSQRKNADRDDGCTTFLGLGTDLNRNYPFLWNCCGGSSGSPCNETYRGPAADSEEETQAVTTKIRSLIPDQRGPGNNDPSPLTATGIYLDMHSYGPTDLYLWGWTNAQTPNDADLKNIDAHMSATNASPPGNDYEYCQSGPCLYVTDGASDDWEYGELGAPGYTVEIGTTFFPSYSCIDNPCGASPGLWPENRGLLLYMAKIARTPYLTNRGPDVNTIATVPMTVTQGTNSQLIANINYNWTDNGYLQNVGGAEYYLDTPPWAGGSPIAMTPSDGNFNSPTEVVQATISTGSIAVGRHIIYVRGHGVSDYGGLGSWGPISAVWLTVTSAGGSTPTSTGTVVPSTATLTRTSTAAPPTATRTGTSVPSSVTSTATRTNTAMPPSATSIATSTSGSTSTPASETGTPFPCCGSMTGGVLADCLVDPTPSTSSFQGIVEINNPCPTSVPVTITTELQVSTDGTTWQSWAQAPTRHVSVPPGPPPYAVTETFSNQNIPSQYLYYRIYSVVSETNNCREYFFASTPQDICRSTDATPTASPTSVATATACAITFSDVPTDSTFYTYIRCLACRGIISGYDDGTFRPGNDITRGQIAKIVSNAAGFEDDPGAQIYEDVPVGSPFYAWINRLSNRGFMGGYECGLVPEEPCTPPDNRPYFRPNASATRGQLSKIVSNAAGLSDTPTDQFYTDVPTGHPFYLWIMRLTTLGVMSGYDCGGVGEPCDNENRPYFRPFNNVTRGQSSKIVANTFLPDCVTPVR